MGLTDMFQDLWETQPFWSSSWKPNGIPSGTTWRLCHWRAVREQIYQPQHRFSPWSLEDQTLAVCFTSPNAADSVSVTISKDPKLALLVGPLAPSMGVSMLLLGGGFAHGQLAFTPLECPLS